MTALTTTTDLAREGAFLKSRLATLVLTLRQTSERLSQVRQAETELLANTTDLVLLQPLISETGLIVPAGMRGRVRATYEQDNERGWVVQFGSLMARVPVSSGQADPAGGDA